MNEKLLPAKTAQQLIETATILITQLKKINDNLNANEPEDYDEVKMELTEVKQKFSEASKQLKEIQIKINKMTLGYDQKTKVKAIKENYFKELNRYKQIMQDRITWMYDNNKDAKRQEHRNSFARQQTFNSYAQQTQQQDQEKMQMQQMYQVQEIPINDLELDQMIILEKDQEINQLLQEANELHKVVEDVNLEISKQGGNLEIVTENQSQTKENLVDTNKNLTQAEGLQKESNNKLVIVLGVVVIIVIVSIVLGVTYG